jgi:hypothetical protein
MGDWTSFRASKPIALLCALRWTVGDMFGVIFSNHPMSTLLTIFPSSSINLNQSASRVTGAAYNIYLELWVSRRKLPPATNRADALIFSFTAL